MAVGQALFQQALEILVLLGTRVLELVDHEIEDHRPYPLVHEVGAAVKHRADQLVGVTNEDGVGLVTVFLEEQVNHRQHAQQAQVVLDVLEKGGLLLQREMFVHELMQAPEHGVIGLVLAELVKDFLIIDGFPALLGQRLVVGLGEEIIECAAFPQARADGLQFTPEGGQVVGHLIIAVLGYLLHRFLELIDAREIGHEASVFDAAQIGADVVHAAAEEFAVDLLGKLVEVTSVVKEFPLAFIGITMHEVTLVILDPLVNRRGATLLAQREQEIVYCHAHGIILLELDIVVEITVQFTGEVTQDGLEERVDGAHVEVAVVKQQFAQRQACQLTHPTLVQTGFLDETLKIVAAHTRL